MLLEASTYLFICQATQDSYLLLYMATARQAGGICKLRLPGTHNNNNNNTAPHSPQQAHSSAANAVARLIGLIGHHQHLCSSAVGWTDEPATAPAQCEAWTGVWDILTSSAAQNGRRLMDSEQNRRVHTFQSSQKPGSPRGSAMPEACTRMARARSTSPSERSRLAYLHGQVSVVLVFSAWHVCDQQVRRAHCLRAAANACMARPGHGLISRWGVGCKRCQCHGVRQRPAAQPPCRLQPCSAPTRSGCIDCR